MLVETRQQAKQVIGASCELTNSKGKWFVSTPGSIQIRRSNDDLLVVCTKDGIEPGRANVVSDTKGSMFGNILLGGGIGAVVDHNTGAAYEYPTLIQVMMGETLKIDATTTAQPNAPQTTASTSTSTLGMEDAKKKCVDLGFKMGTDSFGQCVLKLTK